jgi:hypothetical protein
LAAIPDSSDAKKYMTSIEEKYRVNDKQYALSIIYAQAFEHQASMLQ